MPRQVIKEYAYLKRYSVKSDKSAAASALQKSDVVMESIKADARFKAARIGTVMKQRKFYANPQVHKKSSNLSQFETD